MLRRANPPKTSWTIIVVSGAGNGGTVRACAARRRLLRRDGHDLALAPRNQDVVVLVERVVLLRRKGPPVGLDEPAVLAEGLEGVANPGSVGGARTLDGERDQVHRIVRVGRTDRGEDVLRPLDRVLRLERGDPALARLALLAEERVGLDEHD